jgi:hypothetical protein
VHGRAGGGRELVDKKSNLSFGDSTTMKSRTSIEWVCSRNRILAATVCVLLVLVTEKVVEAPTAVV